MVFRLLLRNWLQQTAREKLRETVVESVRREAGSAQPEPAGKEPAEPPPCHAGVVFALSNESGGLEDLLAGVVATRGEGFAVKQGGLGGRGVVLIESGAGLVAAQRATEALIAGHRPSWVLAAGFAGGLSASVKRYDIVMADSVVDEAGQALTIELKVDPASLAADAGGARGPVAERRPRRAFA